MNKAYHFFLQAMLFTAPFTTQAQPTSCSIADDMLQVRGAWKKGADWTAPGNNPPTDMKPGVTGRSDKIQQIIQSAYREPRGLEAEWRREIAGVPPFGSHVAAYGLVTYLFQYYCHPTTHQLATGDEASDFIEVHVNNFGRYMQYDTSMRIGHYYIALMYPRIGKLKNTDLFQISLVRENERFLIISRDGQLPYQPLTRKAYLTTLRRKLQKEETRLIDKEVRFASNEERKTAAAAYWKSHYDPKIAVIDNYLATTADTALNEVALVRDMQEFKRFYTEAEGGRMPVTLNPNYFDGALQPVAPQFMLIYWSWDDGEGLPGGLLRPVRPDLNVCCKVSKYFKDSIERQLDVQALQHLLDK